MAYVTRRGAAEVVAVDLRELEVRGSAGLPMPTSRDIAITSDGATAYVTDAFEGFVTPVDLETLTAGEPIACGEGTFGIEIAPDDRFAYVADDIEGLVRINLATNTVDQRIPTGTTNRDLAIAPTPTTPVPPGPPPARPVLASPMFTG